MRMVDILIWGMVCICISKFIKLCTKICAFYCAYLSIKNILINIKKYFVKYCASENDSCSYVQLFPLFFLF